MDHLRCSTAPRGSSDIELCNIDIVQHNPLHVDEDDVALRAADVWPLNLERKPTTGLVPGRDDLSSERANIDRESAKETFGHQHAWLVVPNSAKCCEHAYKVFSG